MSILLRAGSGLSSAHFGAIAEIDLPCAGPALPRMPRRRNRTGERSVAQRGCATFARLANARSSQGPVRSAGNGGQSFLLATHAAQRRTNADVVGAHGGVADRIRLRDRTVLRAHGAHARGVAGTSAGGTAIPGTSADFLRRGRPFDFALGYWWALRYLWSETYAPIAGVTTEQRQTPIVAIAILLVFIGTCAFFAVLLRAV